MAEKKTNILAVLQILQQYTDSEHLLSRDQLFQMLENCYGIEMDRRTLYSCIHSLQSFGYDIEDYEQNKEGYRITEREFEESEAILLCNAVHASNFIPRKYSGELIKKILGTQSIFAQNEYRHTVFVDNLRKKDNPEFFLNLDKLEKAIRDQKKIQFQYMHYDLKRRMVPRRNEPYLVSPYYMVYAMEKTYLIGKTLHHEEEFTHYRIDRMKNITILDEPVLRLEKKEDPYVYAANKLYMYGGEEVAVTLRCRNAILDDIIDLYGRNISIRPIDSDYFEAKVRSTRQGIIYLAQQYLSSMTITDPKDLRNQVKKILRQGLKDYSSE